MKPIPSSPPTKVLAHSALAAIALFALFTAHAEADVNVTYATGKEVPVTAPDFTPVGNVNFTLNYTPAKGTELMVLRNTGSGIIRGTFNNLAQGQTIALQYRGATYHFVANYHGGNGNDLVLVWTTEDPMPATTLRKLDPQVVLALKKLRGQAPFDKPTSLRPDIPIQIAGRVLLKIEAPVSGGLLDQIARLGGKAVEDSKTATSVEALIPLSQVEALASRADVKSISPARPTGTSRIKR